MEVRYSGPRYLCAWCRRVTCCKVGTIQTLCNNCVHELKTKYGTWTLTSLAKRRRKLLDRALISKLLISNIAHSILDYVIDDIGRVPSCSDAGIWPFLLQCHLGDTRGCDFHTISCWKWSLPPNASSILLGDTKLVFRKHASSILGAIS